MNIIDNKIENQTEDVKLYSSRAIGGATFLGGPIAAGYLIGENFKALNKPKEGKISLIIGILSTLLIFTILFMVPETMMDKMPNQVIPMVYTSIIYGIVEWKMGDILKLHKEKGNAFFSGWKAAGVGFVSLLIMSVGILAYALLPSNDDIYNEYNTELSVFSKNEEETLVFYDHVNTQSNIYLLQELENSTIPKWKENIEIIKRTSALKNLPSELAKQNVLLLKYAQLRLEAFELMKRALEEDTDEYSSELEKIHLEINEQLSKLN